MDKDYTCITDKLGHIFFPIFVSETMEHKAMKSPKPYRICNNTIYIYIYKHKNDMTLQAKTMKCSGNVAMCYGKVGESEGLATFSSPQSPM